MWRDIGDDFRFALRNLRKSPGAAAAVVLMLSVAIGSNAAVFGAVDGVLLKPMPIASPDRLVVIWESNPGRSQTVREVSHRNYTDWRAQSRSFDGMAAMSSATWGTVLDDRIDLGRAERSGVSGSFFDLLGAPALLGRTLRPDDDRHGAPRVAVLGHALWQQRFGADPRIVGAAVRLNGDPFTVVGVMPRGFSYPQGAELWTAIVPELERFNVPGKLDAVEARHYGMLYVIGRLKPAVTAATARAELDTIVRRLPGFASLSGGGPAITVTPLVDQIFGRMRRALVLLFGMVGLVLAAACANVSSLLITRATLRRRDTAVKIALGASRARILREWIAETAIITCAATGCGLMLARVGLGGLVALAPSRVPQLDEVTIDARIAAFSAGLAILVALACAVAPALHSAPSPLTERLKETKLMEGREGRRMRRVLIVAQMAIATALMVGAALLVRSVANLRSLDLGFRPERVVTLTVEPQVESTSRYRAILDRVAVIPGVQAAGAVYLRPLAHGPIGMDSGLLLEGQRIEEPATWRNNPTLNFQAVTPGYFAAMRIEARQGRLFTTQDHERAPGVVIVSEAAAQRLWPGENPIGRRVSVAGGRTEDGRFPWQTVVGVVSNVRYRGIDDVRLDVYMPATQTLNRVKHLMVRTSSPPLSMVPMVRAAVAGAGARVLVEHAATLAHVVDEAVAPWRFSMTMFVALAVIGLSLAAIGLFGLVAYSVAQRTPEIALRIAIGARPSRVMRMLLWEGGRLAIVGVACGVAASLLLARFLSDMLFQVEPHDPRTFAAVVALLGAVALLATYLAARRATGIDPIVLLRGN